MRFRHGQVKAYIHEDRQVMEQIEQALGELQELLGCTYKLETAEVRDELGGELEAVLPYLSRWTAFGDQAFLGAAINPRPAMW